MFASIRVSDYETDGPWRLRSLRADCYGGVRNQMRSTISGSNAVVWNTNWKELLRLVALERHFIVVESFKGEIGRVSMTCRKAPLVTRWRFVGNIVTCTSNTYTFDGAVITDESSVKPSTCMSWRWAETHPWRGCKGDSHCICLTVPLSDVTRRPGATCGSG